jgi:hypothetical protein
MQWTPIEDSDDLEKAVATVTARAKLTPREHATCTGMSVFLQHQKMSKIASERKAKKAAKHGGSSVHEQDLALPPFHEERNLYQDDVAGAFFLTLWHEVSMAATSVSGVETLQLFLQAVDASLPALKAGAVIEALKQDPHLLESHLGWKAKVEEAGIPKRGHGANVQWRLCQGSSWDQRGLPCGLWSLYHTMLANAHGQATQTLYAIRRYIAGFFVCYECRRHFLLMPMKLHYNASDDDAMLWLWAAHNTVNQRLADEQGKSRSSSDPAVPKVQWPTRADCPACHKVKGGWDEAAVARHLRTHYTWANLKSSPMDEALQMEPYVALPTDHVQASFVTPLQKTSQKAGGGTWQIVLMVLGGVSAAVTVLVLARGSRKKRKHRTL